jgi:hypothetical protein
MRSSRVRAANGTPKRRSKLMNLARSLANPSVNDTKFVSFASSDMVDGMREEAAPNECSTAKGENFEVPAAAVRRCAAEFEVKI